MSESTIAVSQSSHTARAQRSHQRVAGDNRLHRRFRVDGGLIGVRCAAFEPKAGTVSVRRRSWLGWLPFAAPEFQLNDLSRGGLSFETDRSYQVGERVRISLHLPEWCKPMELQGRVRWVRTVYEGVQVVGVQFNSFGESSDCNPIEALLALARLEARYLDSERPAAIKAREREATAAARS